jgi:F420-non-reducing hydrogenase iron-sulfur subunit
MSDTATAPATPAAETAFAPQVLALICERSVAVDELVNADQRLKEAEHVYVLRFPCSGMIKPSLAQLALDEGWDGVIVVGCAVGDCHFREGNLWARERFLGARAPNKFRRMDQRRVALVWRALTECDEFLSSVSDFTALLRTLGPNPGKQEDGKASRKKR